MPLSAAGLLHAALCCLVSSCMGSALLLSGLPPSGTCCACGVSGTEGAGVSHTAACPALSLPKPAAAVLCQCLYYSCFSESVSKRLLTW